MNAQDIPEYRAKPTPQTDIEMAWDMAYAEKPHRDIIADEGTVARLAIEHMKDDPSFLFRRLADEEDIPHLPEIKSPAELHPIIRKSMFSLAKKDVIRTEERRAKDAGTEAAKSHIQTWEREGAKRSKQVHGRNLQRPTSSAGLPTLGKSSK